MTSNISFDEIRLILSIQGYQLNHQFIIREIGFWSHRIMGVIPFNCKLNLTNVDSFSRKNIYMAETEIHGITLNNRIDNALPASEASSVIKTLYHLTNRDDSTAEYIGILKDENISALVYKSGLGKYLVELDNLELVSKCNAVLPTLHDFKFIIGTEFTKYRPCPIHNKLRGKAAPLCSRVKVEIVANYFQQMLKQQQQNQGQQNLSPFQQQQQQQSTSNNNDNNLFNLFTQQMTTNK